MKVVPDAIGKDRPRIVIGWLIEACMAFTNLFMPDLGRQARSRQPGIRLSPISPSSCRMLYLPVPLGGAITTLFVIERLWTANFLKPDEEAISRTATE